VPAVGRGGNYEKGSALGLTLTLEEKKSGQRDESKFQEPGEETAINLQKREYDTSERQIQTGIELSWLLTEGKTASRRGRDWYWGGKDSSSLGGDAR